MQIEPEFRAIAKRFGEQPGGLWGNSTLATHNLIHALNWHANVPICLANRKGYLRQPKWIKKFFQQDFAGMGGEPIVLIQGFCAYRNGGVA